MPIDSTPFLLSGILYAPMFFSLIKIGKLLLSKTLCGGAVFANSAAMPSVPLKTSIAFDFEPEPAQPARIITAKINTVKYNFLIKHFILLSLNLCTLLISWKLVKLRYFDIYFSIFNLSAYLFNLFNIEYCVFYAIPNTSFCFTFTFVSA